MRYAALIILLTPIMVLAQEAAPVSWEISIPLLLSSLADKIGSLGSGAIVSALAVAAEIALRFVKSERPLSIAHGVAKIVRAASDILEKAADMLDKILPQKLK